MGIKQLPNGSWEVSIYLPGNRRDRNRRWRRRYPTEELAQSAELKLKIARLEGRVKAALAELNKTEVPTSSLKELADVYYEQYVLVANRDPQTKFSRLKLLTDQLGHIPVEELSPFDVTMFISERRKMRKGLSAATINRDLAVLKHMLNWAAEQDLISRHPIPRLRKLHEQHMPAIADRYLPILEQALHETLTKLRPECEPVFRFLYETGCRREEALSLKHEQVFLDDHLVVLPKTKAGELRYIALTQPASVAIRRMPRVGEYVFYNPKTLDRWFDCRKPWNSSRKAAGYPWLRIKDMRTAFGIRLSNTPGLEKHTIQTLLGHSRLSTTERFYAFHSHRLAVQRGLRLIEGAKQKQEEQKEGAA